MDYDQLQKDVATLEKSLPGIAKAEPASLKGFAVGLKSILVQLLKSRRESIRPGQIFKDAAAKNLVPGDVAPRGDALLIRWAGNVSPTDPQIVQEDAAKLASLAEKVLPVLKAYTKEKA
jgi:hypothetical protein